jgi:hypothetical protein
MTRGIGRRTLLTGMGAGATLALASETVAAPAIGKGLPDIAVIGAGAFGGWTALSLRERGAKVTLVDLYGPGNPRASSGDESRLIRAGYFRDTYSGTSGLGPLASAAGRVRPPSDLPQWLAAPDHRGTGRNSACRLRQAERPL